MRRTARRQTRRGRGLFKRLSSRFANRRLKRKYGRSYQDSASHGEMRRAYRTRKASLFGMRGLFYLGIAWVCYFLWKKFIKK